jgi:integrase
MPEVTEGGIYIPGKNTKNYRMYLTIDGQKQYRKTSTPDPDEAQAKLDEWRAQAKIGFKPSAGLRYEELRDDYLKSGKNVQGRILEELNIFFKDIWVNAIGGRLDAFREWRESLKQVLEYKQETLAKEISLRTVRAMNGRRKPLSAVETAKIEKEATEWVENGVKATTDKRLTYLRAMFRHAFKKTKKITQADIPYFPIMGKQVDNVKQNKFSDSDFERILSGDKDKGIKGLPTYLHPLVKFLRHTGMRSGQAKAITWDMIDQDNILRMPGFLTKSGNPYSLTLTDANGKPYEGTEYLVNMEKENRLHGEPVFNTTALREDWREVCHNLKLGIYDKKTRAYRGAQLHDFRRTAVATMITKRKASETAAMSVTGHKTNSVFKRYAIENPDLQRTALG